MYNRHVEERLASERNREDERADPPVRPEENRVVVGDQQCPRCHKFFTASYWNGETMIQARCLSCDLKWPRPDVV